MPCILQMVLVFCGLTAAEAQRFRGGRFLAAYIGTYAALGVVAAAFGELLARLEAIVVVQVAGGAAIAFVGLSRMGVLHRRVLQACGSATGFATKGAGCRGSARHASESPSPSTAPAAADRC